MKEQKEKEDRKVWVLKEEGRRREENKNVLKIRGSTEPMLIRVGHTRNPRTYDFIKDFYFNISMSHRD